MIRSTDGVVKLAYYSHPSSHFFSVFSVFFFFLFNSCVVVWLTEVCCLLFMRLFTILIHNFIRSFTYVKRDNLLDFVWFSFRFQPPNEKPKSTDKRKRKYCFVWGAKIPIKHWIYIVRLSAQITKWKVIIIIIVVVASLELFDRRIFHLNLNGRSNWSMPVNHSTAMTDRRRCVSSRSNPKRMAE